MKHFYHFFSLRTAATYEMIIAFCYHDKTGDKMAGSLREKSTSIIHDVPRDKVCRVKKEKLFLVSQYLGG